MATQRNTHAIKGAKVLMVGAGGIGCELLKTLALSGFQDIHIIDMDTIEVSNLNRQFLFRQSHVGLSKAKVARDAVLKFRPNISIESHHANVKDPVFSVDFFKQFNVVLNGLDNLDARRHVNRLCLAADVPLIESGTTGFLGQVTVHVKGITECYECQPKPAPKTYPVCTITNTPSKFVHCIVWAKELLFAKLFGDKSQANDLNVRSSDGASSSEQAKDVFEHRRDEDIDQYARRIYDHVFGYNIEVALANEETWKNRTRPNPIYSRDVLPNDVTQQNGNVENNGATTDPSSVSAMVSLGLRNPQDVWSLMENSRVFLEALKLFFIQRGQEIGNLTFDKDDQLAVEFVTTAANIRASAFGIPLHSLFEAKGIAGNIVHAVATTNAIIAGLIVIEAVKVLQNDTRNYRMTYCLEHPTRKMLLMPVEPFEPNASCYVCSETPLLLEINTRRAKLWDIAEKVVKNKLGMNSPLIMHGAALLYEVGDDLDEAMIRNYAANLDKVLSEFPSPITSGTILTIEDLQQELSCNINIKHREDFDEEKEPDGMILSGWTQPTSVVQATTSNATNAGNTLSVSDGMVLSGSTQATPVVQATSDAINAGNTSSAKELEADKTNVAACGKKRKLSEVSQALTSTVADDTKGRGKLEVLDDDDDDDEIVMFDDWGLATNKKLRLP